MYYVVHCLANGHKRAPSVIALHGPVDWRSAVELVIDLSAEQCDVLRNNIRDEVEADGDFTDPNGEWSVCIVQAEE